MINKILQKFDLILIRIYPRHSVREVLKRFKNNPIKIIEVGTWRGIHAQKMFKTLNVEKMYIIDPWLETERYRDSNPAATQDFLNSAEKETERRLKGKPFVKIKDFSDDAIKKIKEKVDFIYIDGDHSYNMISQILMIIMVFVEPFLNSVLN
jgi:hypothetical protein